MSTTTEAIPTERCPDCVHGRRPVPGSGYSVEDLRGELDARRAANDDAAAAARAARRRSRRDADAMRQVPA
jgi:hypothetical protein